MKHTVSEVRLKNGARGLFVDIPEATVMSFQFQFRAGNRFVKNQDIYETAHIMEHMAFGANARYKDEQKYEAEFTRNGAYHNAYTSDDSMVYVSDCADFEWDRVVDLQQLAIAEPRFNKDDLLSETGNVKSELTGYLNNHNRLLWPKVQQALGEPVLTYPQRLKTINNVTLDDIKEHYARTHTSSNMRFVVAGKLHGRKKQLTDMLEQWQLERGERLHIPKTELHCPEEPVLVRRQEASNMTLGLTLNIPRRLNDAELDDMASVNHMLTGTLHSRIFGAVRKKGLAYGVASETSAYEYTSSWDFVAQVNTETVRQLVDIFVREIRSILDGNITEEELDAAKQYALGRHQMGAQTVGQINHWYANRYFFDDMIDDYDMRPKAIRAITKESIIDIAREFVDERCWLLGGVGNADKELMQELHDKVAKIF